MRHLLSLLITLALCCPAAAENWMVLIDDDVYPSTLSVPGAHDAATDSEGAVILALCRRG